MVNPSTDRAHVATEDEAEFVRQHGDAETSRLLEFPRATLPRIAGRLRVREGSLLLFRERLARYRARVARCEAAESVSRPEGPRAA